MDKGEIYDLKETKEISEKKQNKQLIWMIVLLAGLILIVLVVPYSTNYIVKNFIDKFEYISLEFQKTKMGDIILYTTEIPVVNDKGDIVDSYQVNFRNDPRELGEIEIDSKIKKDGVKFVKRNVVYVSINPDMKACSDNSLAMFILGGFLTDSGLQVESAMTDENYANETNFSYKDCKHSSANTIIKINSGDEIKINRERTNCYEIIYNDCEIIKAVERFNLAILEEYMSHFVNENEVNRSFDGLYIK